MSNTARFVIGIILLILSAPDPRAAPDGKAAVAGTVIDSSGRAHHYSNTRQSNQLSRLNLSKPGSWETIAQGPRLQGLAMVAHGGKLYRAGGFTAHNEEGDGHDLRSIAEFVRFDPDTGQWESLPDLPEPRSSHDAVVIHGKLYVMGECSPGAARRHESMSLIRPAASGRRGPAKSRPAPTPTGARGWRDSVPLPIPWEDVSSSAPTTATSGFWSPAPASGRSRPGSRPTGSFTACCRSKAGYCSMVARVCGVANAFTSRRSNYPDSDNPLPSGEKCPLPARTTDPVYRKRRE